MNRAKIQDYIDQREEQRSLIYHVEKSDKAHFTVNGHPYELVKEYRNGFDAEKFAERFSSVLSKYDYIVGDWGYDQLRLKGFYDSDNPLFEPDQSVETIEDYLFEYCNFGCAYFIIHNNDICIPRQHSHHQRNSKKRTTPIIHERRRKIKQANVRQRHNQQAERVKSGHHQKFVMHQRKKRS